MWVVRMVNTRGRLRAALSATWTTVLITILFSGCNLDNEWRGPALVCAQSTDLQADGWEQAVGQGAALDGLRSRRLSAVRVEKDGDRVGGGEYDYEYMDVTDTARDADVSAEGEVVEEKVAAFGRLSSDDIAKDVFSARMQDVLSRRAHVIETPNRIKVKAGKRYLAPRAGDADGLSLSSGVDGQGNRSRHQSNFIDVSLLTIGMALSAGFGAVPFFFVKQLSPTMNGLATAVACGVMFAASFDLIHEGQPYGPIMVILGIGIGAVFIQLMQRYLDSLGDVSFGKLHGAKAKRLILVVGIMAAHAIGEGCGVGVSFVGENGFDQGLLTALAIGIHNIPEGMAKATVLVSQGATPVEALFWSVVTCLPQPLMAIPSFLFVNMFEFLLPVSLGFAAGCMIWMVFAELLPEALKDCDAGHVASAATFSAAGLEGFRMLMESLDAAYVGREDEEVAFEDTSLRTDRPPKSIKLSFAVVLVLVSVVTSWTPDATRIAHLMIPVLLGMVSVVMGLLGAMPLARSLLFTHTDASRLHILSAAAIGMLGIILLRNIMLDHSHAMLARRRGKGDGLLGIATPSSAHGSQGAAAPAASAMDNHRLLSRMHRGDQGLLASSPRPPIRALAVILIVTSILHALVFGAQLRRLGLDRSLAPSGPESVSLAATYGGLLGIIAGCSSFLWEPNGNPSVFRSSAVALMISGVCVMARRAVALPGLHRFILPYPRGLLDTMSYVSHGALTMTALLTMAVGMTSQPRYTRFGVILACLLVAFIHVLGVGGWKNFR